LLLMPARGVISWESLGPIILLFVALTYFYAGLHLDPPLRWIGLLAAGGYLVVLTVPAYPWTIVGVVLAAGCAMAGIKEMRSRAVAAH
ncbi:MAG TPA: hypothetical protein VGY57_13485, partial [Vicinamibacterales bacterium]|nr:hypothetical protein [Vicinamibacterales bacterium]